MPDDSPDEPAADPETAADDARAVSDDAGTASDDAGTATGDFGAVTEDIQVAAVAAACTVGLTLALRYGVGRDVPFVYRILPLGPYFLSLFTGRMNLGDLDAPRTWSALTVVVTAVLFVYFGIL